MERHEKCYSPHLDDNRLNTRPITNTRSENQHKTSQKLYPQFLEKAATQFDDSSLGEFDHKDYSERFILNLPVYPNTAERVKLISISRVAKILGIRSETVDSLINEGKLRAIQIGKRKKIPFIEIERFIQVNLKPCPAAKSNQKMNAVKAKFDFQRDSFDSRNFVQKIMSE